MEGDQVMADRRCWWCGQPAEVDTELPESGGMVKDTETSWLCADGEACARRAYAAMRAASYQRNRDRPQVTP